MNNTLQHYDVIIVGGGLVGLLQALLLAQNGIKALCIDKQSSEEFKNSPFSKRTTAISYGSQQLIQSAGIWEEIVPHACPIQDIKVTDGSTKTLLNFDIEEDEDASHAGALGWVIENHYLRDIVLNHLIKIKNATYKEGIAVNEIDIQDSKISITTNESQSYDAQLLIGADGRQSFIRKALSIPAEEFSYHQRAIISIVTHQNPHQNIAYEHFKASGPFAILPMMDDESGKHRSSIVWTEEENPARSILDFDEATYMAGLKAQFPIEYGDILSSTERFAYPLGFIHARNYIAQRTVLIGDAAHGIHPIAGQGLNLGLRDVTSLTQLLMQAHQQKQDLGIADLLEEYQSARKRDNVMMSLATDNINRIFSSSNKSLKAVRQSGLRLIHRVKPMKRFVLHQMMGKSKA